jgi:perosamine synthetase
MASDAERLKYPDPEPSFSTNSIPKLQVSYPFIPPGAKENVLQAIEDGKISSATSVVQEFEAELRKYFQVSFSKACSNGYSAIVLALKLANVKPGDQVLVPTFTMAAVVNAVFTVGAKPVFVDCEEEKFNPSVRQYEQCITPYTRALIVTHTYGIPADCSPLSKLCKSKGIIFIEDIAEAIGTEYCGKLVGTFGNFACASLYANKTITAGDGGFLLSNCDLAEAKEMTQRANSYANHGFSKDFHFLHFESSGNYKISGLQAAFATPAVSIISEVMQDRERIASHYRKHLAKISNLTLMPKNIYGRDAPWMFGVMVESKKLRTEVRQKLAIGGIETRDFFFPLHLQPMVIEILGVGEEYPHAEKLGTTGFYLPTFYGMKNTDIERVTQCLKAALKIK